MQCEEYGGVVPLSNTGCIAMGATPTSDKAMRERYA